ncbi:MAG: barstar family protein, partial [Rudaea sp.]
MTVWERMLSGQIPSGVYRLPARTRSASVQRAVEPSGWRVFHIDGRAISDKSTFLQAAADALQFPRYVGKNWDAFEEALRDLDWVPATGYILILSHVGRFARSADWPVLRTILNEVCRYWQTQQTPVYVLLGDIPDAARLSYPSTCKFYPDRHGAVWGCSFFFPRERAGIDG